MGIPLSTEELSPCRVWGGDGPSHPPPHTHTPRGAEEDTEIQRG